MMLIQIVSLVVFLISGCGKHGHLEQYASATGIVWKTTELLKTTTESSMLTQ